MPPQPPLGRTVIASSKLFVPQAGPFDAKNFKLVRLLQENTVALNQIGFKLNRINGSEGHSLLQVLDPRYESSMLRYFVDSSVVHLCGSLIGKRDQRAHRSSERNLLRAHLLLFTLPPDARPPAAHDFLVLCDNGRSDEAPGTALIRVLNNGNFYMLSATRDSSLKSFCRVELDGIRFKLPEKIGNDDGLRLALACNICDTRPSSQENNNIQFRSAGLFTQGPCVYLTGQVMSPVNLLQYRSRRKTNELYRRHSSSFLRELMPVRPLDPSQQCGSRGT